MTAHSGVSNLAAESCPKETWVRLDETVNLGGGRERHRRKLSRPAYSRIHRGPAGFMLELSSGAERFRALRPCLFVMQHRWFEHHLHVESIEETMS